jgi:starch synthase (maltosyl-transferring)
MLGLDDHATIEVESLLDGDKFSWHGKWQRIRLNPQFMPAAIWRVKSS